MAKHKTTYKNVPEWGEIDQLVQVKDFLPKPEDLVAKTKLRKVTLSLSEESIDFFKEKAEQYKTSYQPMIRNLLDEYTRRIRYQ